MNQMTQTRCRTATAALAAFIVFSIPNAFAQQSAGANAEEQTGFGQIEEIIVTGTKREVMQQDLAIAFGNAAHHRQRILVMNATTGLAHPALVGVACGGLAGDRLAAV